MVLGNAISVAIASKIAVEGALDCKEIVHVDETGSVSVNGWAAEEIALGAYCGPQDSVGQQVGSRNGSNWMESDNNLHDTEPRPGVYLRHSLAGVGHHRRGYCDDKGSMSSPTRK